MDQIQNHWFKYFLSTHYKIAEQFNKCFSEPATLPQFLTQSITYFKTRENNTTNPKIDRPIA